MALNKRNIIIIKKREFRAFLNNPASYLVVVVFLALWQFLFFRNAFLVGESSLRILFDALPWLLVILVPAVTMGTIAREKAEGTLEVSLTHPVRELEFIIGKFLGVLAYVSLILATSVVVALSFSFFGKFDWGIYTAQLIGSVLFAAAFISLGVFSSSLLKNQVGVLLLAVALSFVFNVIGSELVTANVPLFVVPILERLSLLSHYRSVSRGVIDIRDVWYFLTFIVVFLGLAYFRLLALKYGNRKSEYKNYVVGIGLFIGIAVLTNVIGNRIPGRLDLTADKVFSLSGSTIKLVKGLDDVVNITLYSSSKLPAQYQSVLRDVRDILRDYENESNGKIKVEIIDPSGNLVQSQKAIGQGIQQIQFNVVGQEEFKVKTGFLGLVVSYGGKNEIVPFLQNSGGLEYIITSFINKLTTKEKKNLRFLSGHGEKNLTSEYGILLDELSAQFNVTLYTIEDSLESGVKEVDPSSDLLMIAGPKNQLAPDEIQAITTYFESGGSIFVLADAYDINIGSLSAKAINVTFSSFLAEYGVLINNDIVFDLRSHETIRFTSGYVSYYLPYPFWIGAVVKEETPVTSKIDRVVFPWTASLGLDTNTLYSQNIKEKKLLTTTPYASTQSGDVVISPKQSFPDESLGELLLAVSLESEKHGGKMVIVGDSDFLANEQVQSSTQNLTFGINAISWLGGVDSMADIQVKANPFGRLMFKRQSHAFVLKYSNLALVMIVPSLYATLRLAKRRGLRNRRYEK